MIGTGTCKLFQLPGDLAACYREQLNPEARGGSRGPDRVEWDEDAEKVHQETIHTTRLSCRISTCAFFSFFSILDDEFCILVF